MDENSAGRSLPGSVTGWNMVWEGYTDPGRTGIFFTVLMIAALVLLVYRFAQEPSDVLNRTVPFLPGCADDGRFLAGLSYPGSGRWLMVT
jgi:hypothetical protein